LAPETPDPGIANDERKVSASDQIAIELWGSYGEVLRLQERDTPHSQPHGRYTLGGIDK
jgi:hypothetical protein